MRCGNSSMGKGYALYGLGKVKMMKSQMQDAKILLENALAMHKQAQSPVGENNAQHFLNIVLSKLNQSQSEQN